MVNNTDLNVDFPEEREDEGNELKQSRYICALMKQLFSLFNDMDENGDIRLRVGAPSFATAFDAHITAPGVQKAMLLPLIIGAN